MRLTGAGLALLFAACTPAAVDEAGFAEAADLAESVDPGNLERTVTTIANEHRDDVTVPCDGYEPKDGFPACELSRDAAVSEVADTLASFGYAPVVEPLGDSPPAFNVIAERQGETRPEEVILVGAHLDAFYSGADDNTSAVAALLEIARIVRSRRFARTVRFVGFDLEEYGAVGSTRYVAAGGADDVVLALILECLGYASSDPDSQDGLPGIDLGSRGDFLLVVANGDSIESARRSLALNHAFDFTSMKGLAAGGSAWYPLTSALTRSDNGPFWLESIPALMFTDTADLRNPHYHETTDTPETLSLPFFVGATQAVAASVGLFAQVLP